MLTKKLPRRELLRLASVIAGSALFNPGQIQAAKTTDSSVKLTTEEKNDLLFMREEEKLARDVYLTLFEVWGTPVFASIAVSEQLHMDAILKLLNLYKLSDPAAGKLVGEFVNPELQALYNQLIERGRLSALDALMVGGIIEETDIEDLTSAMEDSRLTNIDSVYSNLLNGSYNHLRAFAKNIESLTGLPYVAQVVPQDVVDAILNL